MAYKQRKKTEVISEIEKHIRKKSFLQLFWGYEFWTIGITEEPPRRKKEHKYPNKWFVRKAESSNEARKIEKHFLDKGMSGGTGGGKNPIFIYVY